MDETVFQLTGVAAHLKVSGADAATFLQGQFTNDLRRSESSSATYGLWLNHKGRTLADSTVISRPAGAFEIVSRSSAAASIRERLETYIIADDVVVEDVTPSSGMLLLVGPRASEGVRHLGLVEPAPGQCSSAGDALVIPARMDVRPSWMVVAPPNQLTAFADTLRAAGFRSATAEELDARRIRAGIPTVPAELGADDLPNEGGLDRDAISYTKGCYLGQEVMARLHNLGQVRRRLFVVHIASGEPRAVPAELFHGGQKVGELRGSVSLGGGQSIGLAMASTALVRLGTVLSLTPGGEPLVRIESMAEGRAP